MWRTEVTFLKVTIFAILWPKLGPKYGPNPQQNVFSWLVMRWNHHSGISGKYITILIAILMLNMRKPNENASFSAFCTIWDLNLANIWSITHNAAVVKAFAKFFKNCFFGTQKSPYVAKKGSASATQVLSFQ